MAVTVTVYRDQLAPLIESVHHACKSDDEALNDIFWEQIFALL